MLHIRDLCFLISIRDITLDTPGGNKLHFKTTAVDGKFFSKWMVDGAMYNPPEQFVRLTALISMEYGNGDGYVIDIGANMGWYSLISLSLGYRVTSFELQKLCVAELSYSAQVNRFSDRLTVLRMAVSSVDDADFSAVSPAHNCMNMGTEELVSIGGNIDTVKSITIDTWMGNNNHIKQLQWLKLDTEGMEIEVLRGMKETIAAHKIQSLTFELTVGWWEKSSKCTITEGFAVLTQLCRKGGYKWAIKSGRWTFDEESKTLADLEHIVSGLANADVGSGGHIVQFNMWWTTIRDTSLLSGILLHDC